MKKKPNTALVGQAVVIKADLLDLKANPHTASGKHATIISSTGRAYIADLGDGTTTVLHDGDFAAPAASQAEAAGAPAMAHLAIAIDSIKESPTNPRQHFDAAALDELAASIKEVGIMQPILVRPMGNGFEAVFGHRRLRAAAMAGLTEVTAMVRSLTDTQAARWQAIENLQREDLDPMEEAEGYAQMMAQHKLNADAMADAVGMSRTHIYNQLKLLDLCAEARTLVRSGALTRELAVELARVPIIGKKGGHDGQMQALNKIFHGKAETATKDTPAMSYRAGRDMLARDFREGGKAAKGKKAGGTKKTKHVQTLKLLTEAQLAALFSGDILDGATDTEVAEAVQRAFAAENNMAVQS